MSRCLQRKLWELSVGSRANGHGIVAAPNDEIRHARSPYPNPPRYALPLRTREKVQTNRYASFTLMKPVKQRWVPDRQEIIWIDCNPQAGREMRDVHPFLVLSPRLFNEKTSLVIGLPMATAEYNSDNPFAVAVGSASGKKAGQTSYVLCHQPKSFDWRLRKAKAHPLKTLPDELFAQVCERLNQIIQVG